MHNTTPLFEALDLSCTFGHGKKRITALDAVSFTVYPGEIVSLVGESGSGKTTLARVLLQLQPYSGGGLLFNGKQLPPRKIYWQSVQMVFQNPYSAFNQFFTINAQLAECFNLRKVRPSPKQIRDEIDDALLKVSLDPATLRNKYPFELSGGQMQRLLLARIFLIKPDVLIADEPTSMIDACSRRSILDCLLSLKKELDMTIVFITHDIGLAAKVSDRLFVLYRGRIVEQGCSGEILYAPKEPYTQKLLVHASRGKAM